jgi:hypothetical protein
LFSKGPFTRDLSRPLCIVLDHFNSSSSPGPLSQRRLLDEFLSTVVTEKAEARRLMQESQAKASVSVVKEWPLDPIISGLVTFANDGDLEEKINAIYDRMDQDESGAMSLEEV